MNEPKRSVGGLPAEAGEGWVPPASSSSPHSPYGQDARAPLMRGTPVFCSQFHCISGTSNRAFPLVDESVQSHTVNTYRELVKPGKFGVNSIQHHHP
jgi:hypothetical protein